MSPDFEATARAALTGADQSFADTGDVMEALSWVAFAAKAGQPIPPRIGRWLYKALNDYRSGAAQTMDAAMGLDGKGRPPRRKLHEDSRLRGALARMFVLHTIGASIPQAAAMVERLGEFTQSTLADRYRRCGMGKAARAQRSDVLRRWAPSEIEQTLAEYPDHHRIEVEQAKAAIRAMYARHRI